MADQPRLIPKGKDIFYAGGPFDRNEPRSLYNIIPKEAKGTIEQLELDWFSMGEIDLQVFLKPKHDVNIIRLAFWKEYEAAQSSLTQMTLKGMMQYLGGLPSFHVMQVMQEPKSFMWIITPPVSYDNTLEEALLRGLKRINEILDLVIVDPTTKQIDHKTAELILKATAYLDIRKFGKPTERIETTNKSLITTVTARDVKQLGGGRGIELDEKIRALEVKLGRAEVTDVESE